MPIYKKLFVFLILLVAAGVVINQFGNQKKAQPNISPKQEETVSDGAKSVCDEQLENQPDNRVTEKFDGTPKPVDFITTPEAKTFYTMITKAVALGTNFAGHFTVASWGCGADCFGYAIVDTKTGEIITYSGANANYHLRSYSLENRILVLDPVYAGQERKFYKIVEGQDSKSRLELACTEVSSEDMYGLPE